MPPAIIEEVHLKLPSVRNGKDLRGETVTFACYSFHLVLDKSRCGYTPILGVRFPEDEVEIGA